MTRFVALPDNIPAILWRNLLLWFAFLALGALINAALEFPAFERIQLSEKMIGYALAAWGVGSLLAFIKNNSLSQSLSCLGFILSLTAFLTIPLESVAILSFAMAGWTSSLFSGSLRANIQASVPEGYDALPVWAFANQITQIINLAAYGGGFDAGEMGL